MANASEAQNQMVGQQIQRAHALQNVQMAQQPMIHFFPTPLPQNIQIVLPPVQQNQPQTPPRRARQVPPTTRRNRPTVMAASGNGNSRQNVQPIAPRQVRRSRTNFFTNLLLLLVSTF